MVNEKSLPLKHSSLICNSDKGFSSFLKKSKPAENVQDTADNAELEQMAQKRFTISNYHSIIYNHLNCRFKSKIQNIIRTRVDINLSRSEAKFENVPELLSSLTSYHFYFHSIQ